MFLLTDSGSSSQKNKPPVTQDKGSSRNTQKVFFEQKTLFNNSTSWDATGTVLCTGPCGGLTVRGSLA